MVWCGGRPEERRSAAGRQRENRWCQIDGEGRIAFGAVMLAIRQSAGLCQPAEALQHDDLNVPRCGKGPDGRDIASGIVSFAAARIVAAGLKIENPCAGLDHAMPPFQHLAGGVAGNGRMRHAGAAATAAQHLLQLGVIGL